MTVNIVSTGNNARIVGGDYHETPKPKPWGSARKWVATIRRPGRVDENVTFYDANIQDALVSARLSLFKEHDAEIIGIHLVEEGAE